MSDGDAKTSPEKDDNDAAQLSCFSGDEVPVIRGDNRPAKKMMEAFIRSRQLPDVVIIDPFFYGAGKQDSP